MAKDVKAKVKLTREDIIKRINLTLERLSNRKLQKAFRMVNALDRYDSLVLYVDNDIIEKFGLALNSLNFYLKDLSGNLISLRGKVSQEALQLLDEVHALGENLDKINMRLSQILNKGVYEPKFLEKNINDGNGGEKINPNAQEVNDDLNVRV